MARPEVTSRKAGAGESNDAYGVDEFCRRHGFSPQLFYKNRRVMPKTFRVGARVLISREAAADWRREREEASLKFPTVANF